MARKANDEKIEKIYRAIQENPGAKPGWLARLLGLHRSEIIRILPTLDERGYYLAEDERGGLWPFKSEK